jgi:deazaflavin-dependent oxidoreductase (nitroreductase family)
MTQPNSWNQRIIDEFHANAGKVGGPFEGATMLLLTSTGARTGRQHITPLVYLPDGDRYVVIASKGGSPENPDWYYNLKANRRARIEVGTESFDVTASEVMGEERDGLYARQVERRPSFGEYEKKTSRKIPVIALERVT